MRQKDIFTLAVVAFIAAVISLILTSLVFKVPLARNLKVPTADTVSTAFPDIKNDPNYNAIFNKNALDPAQPLKVGDTQNTQPFSSSP